MTVYTLEAQVPWIELPGGFKLVFEAISPTTGLAITGCSVSNVAVYGEDLSASGLIERKIPTLTPDQVEGL